MVKHRDVPARGDPLRFDGPRTCFADHHRTPTEGYDY